MSMDRRKGKSEPRFARGQPVLSINKPNKNQINTHSQQPKVKQLILAFQPTKIASRGNKNTKFNMKLLIIVCVAFFALASAQFGPFGELIRDFEQFGQGQQQQQQQSGGGQQQQQQEEGVIFRGPLGGGVEFFQEQQQQQQGGRGGQQQQQQQENLFNFFG
ncbi:transcription factor asR4 [Drosophila rhopaloa]|uniref:Probable serine/threonine-protein kinase DDB_G0280133 n=1 Tax=Drosophila rhopaloa TaxID=1041015 RepID=A0A6P4F8J3_DRORH|nr:transcription factor asR4 [Drosophila rhopaloa]